MGEAKRRKQLGLMPTIYPFEVRQDGEKLVLVSGPQDETLRQKILDRMQTVLSESRSWPQQYRREYVMAGLSRKLLRTAADVEAIAVPEYRRWKGELLENYDPQASAKDLESLIVTINEYHPLDDSKADGKRGLWLHLEDEFSFDGQRWESFPSGKNPLVGIQYLMQHPVTQLQGDLVVEYRYEQTAEGVQTFEPEPPAEQREYLAEVMRNWYGNTPEDWAQNYYEALDLPEEDKETMPVPQAVLQVIELRQPAPLPGLGAIAVGSVGGLDMYLPYDQRQFSLDGHIWQDYPDELEMEDLNLDEFALENIIGTSRFEAKTPDTKTLDARTIDAE